MKKIIALSILLAIVGWRTPVEDRWVLWLIVFLLAARFLPGWGNDYAAGMLIAESLIAIIAVGLFLAFGQSFGPFRIALMLLLIALIPYTMRVKYVENKNRLKRRSAMRHLQQQR